MLAGIQMWLSMIKKFIYKEKKDTYFVCFIFKLFSIILNLNLKNFKFIIRFIYIGFLFNASLEKTIFL